MGKHIIRTIIFLVAAGVVALGWYLFAQTSVAQSLVPLRGMPPVLFENTIGRGQGHNRSQEQIREFAESGAVPGLHGEWIDTTEFQGMQGVPRMPMPPLFRKNGIDVGMLLPSIGVHLGLIGLVILIVFGLRKVIGFIWNAGSQKPAVSH